MSVLKEMQTVMQFQLTEWYQQKKDTTCRHRPIGNSDNVHVSVLHHGLERTQIIGC